MMMDTGVVPRFGLLGICCCKLPHTCPLVHIGTISLGRILSRTVGHRVCLYLMSVDDTKFSKVMVTQFFFLVQMQPWNKPKCLSSGERVNKL